MKGEGEIPGEIITAEYVVSKGPSTRVRICVRIAIRFRARFVRKQNREPFIFLLAIAMVCLPLFAKKIQKLTCLTPRQQIVHRIVWGFVWEIAGVDGPLDMFSVWFSRLC
jgi:hypothetical protein